MDLYLEIYGWLGAASIITAYFLNSFGKISTGIPYQALNFFGAIGIVAVSLHKQAYPPAGLNAVWALIALTAIVKMKIRD